jgi:hypothetical protein
MQTHTHTHAHTNTTQHTNRNTTKSTNTDTDTKTITQTNRQTETHTLVQGGCVTGSFSIANRELGISSQQQQLAFCEVRKTNISPIFCGLNVVVVV